MATQHNEQKSTDGLRNFANSIRENVALAQEYGDLPIGDVSVTISDNNEDPYVTVKIQQNELEDIYISEDALVDFPDDMELSTLITSTILQGFLTYQAELAKAQQPQET